MEFLFFSQYRQAKYSNITQPATDVSITLRASTPKNNIAATTAGTNAIITSSISERVLREVCI